MLISRNAHYITPATVNKKKLSKFFSSRKIKQNKTKKQTNKIDSANRTWMSENTLCENALYFHIISDIFIPTSSVKNIPTCSSMSTWFTNLWTLPSLLNTWLRKTSAELSHHYKENRKCLSAILAAPVPFGENYSVLGKFFFSNRSQHSWGTKFIFDRFIINQRLYLLESYRIIKSRIHDLPDWYIIVFNFKNMSSVNFYLQVNLGPNGNLRNGL